MNLSTDPCSHERDAVVKASPLNCSISSLECWLGESEHHLTLTIQELFPYAVKEGGDQRAWVFVQLCLDLGSACFIP